MQAQATAWEDIIAAKKEAVGLQLEGEYRSRLAAAHAAVKKRLDYQVISDLNMTLQLPLAGGDSKCAETHGAEAHGGLDHRQREGLHHPGPGGGSTEEMHF